MDNLFVDRMSTRDTATLPNLGILAYRVFPETESINVQLLTGGQEEITIPFKDGEIFMLRNSEICLNIMD